MAYEIIQKLITMNRPGKQLNAVGSIVHETSDPNATDENEQNFFNTGYRGASAHAFVDCDSIIQTIPWNEQAWHAGPTANSLMIGIELCHYDDTTKFQGVWDRAVWLFAWVHIKVLKLNTVTKDNLMSHAESSAKWHETDHHDPVSYFAEFGKTVDDFRASVQTEINNQLNIKPTPFDGLKLQQTLNRLKIRDGKGNSLAEDGIVGSCTKEAIKRLQSICGLTVDGQVSQQTQDAITAILAKPLIQVGSKGIAVRYLQYRIGAIYDGVFGWDTNRKVAVWQGQNGLTQDGIVGPASWVKLIS